MKNCKICGNNIPDIANDCDEAGFGEDCKKTLATTPTDKRVEEIISAFIERFGHIEDYFCCCGEDYCECGGPRVEQVAREQLYRTVTTYGAEREAKGREEERARMAKTMRRKMDEWNTQYHLQHFDRTLSHDSGMAVGYAAATKAFDNLLSGIEAGAPLDTITPPHHQE